MKKNVWKWLTALVVLLPLAGCSFSNQSSNPKQASSTSDSSSLTLNHDSQIIDDAKQMNAAGHYRDSNKKLGTIKLADLNGKQFGTLRKEYFDLQSSNDKFLLKNDQDPKVTNSNSNSNHDSTTVTKTNNSFDDYDDYTGDYTFYNNDDNDRIQSELTINSNGEVIQNNTDGTAFHGVASVKASDASGILSYDVSSDTNNTKTIHANVEIDVTWANGENETYYGYKSYDGGTVLTDGQSYPHGLVNEVWYK